MDKQNDIMKLIQLVTREANLKPPKYTSCEEHLSGLISKIQF